MKGGPQARVSSPVLLRSTLTTSAPRSARIWPAHGPARMRASSSTRKPANGPGMIAPYAAINPNFRGTSGVLARFCPGDGSAALHSRQTINISGKIASRSSGYPSAMSTSFFSEMLNSITERGRALLDRTRDHRGNAAAHSESLAELCEQLLTGRGEASGVALAEEILDKYAALTTGPRIAFFEALANRFGPDRARLDAAIATWQAAPSDKTAAEIHSAAEARRQELLRRLNLAPGGTAALVRMRDQLLDALDRRDDLKAVDADFVHLFSSWFNRGFLVLRRID